VDKGRKHIPERRKSRYKGGEGPAFCEYFSVAGGPRATAEVKANEGEKVKQRKN
jgi:hypothetical protein